MRLFALALGVAWLCPNGIVASDATVAGVRHAEKLLDEGNPVEALREVRSLLAPTRARWLRSAKIECQSLSDGDVFEERQPSAKGLTRKAQRILVLGNLRLDDCPTTARDDLRDQAVAVLEQNLKANPKGPIEQADYAEAIATIRPAVAKKTLEDLAARDVLPSAYGWATLARLRASAGDEHGRDAALATCKRVTKSAAVCKLR